MGRKIIFLDIDGTLTEPGSNVPPKSALTAVREAQKKGNCVFLCTGRNYDMLSPLLPFGFDGVVASCGDTSGLEPGYLRLSHDGRAEGESYGRFKEKRSFQDRGVHERFLHG